MPNKKFMSEEHIEMIDKEYAKAVGKHPEWPNDAVYAAAIVMEESGELIRAAVQYNMEGGSIEAMEKEAIQTIVTSIRFLNALGKYKEIEGEVKTELWGFHAYLEKVGKPQLYSDCFYRTKDDQLLPAVIKEYCFDQLLISVKTEKSIFQAYAKKEELFFTIKNQANENGN